MGDTVRTAAARRIAQAIQSIRGESALLDVDLAVMYGVETRVLVQAVKRHRRRFPADFMFQLTTEEFAELKEARAGRNEWGGRRYAPYAFTEQGTAMRSSVLSSDRAVDVNIEIMRAFVWFRRLLSEHRDLAGKLAQLERRYDLKFREVFDAFVLSCFRRRGRGVRSALGRPTDFECVVGWQAHRTVRGVDSASPCFRVTAWDVIRRCCVQVTDPTERPLE